MGPTQRERLDKILLAVVDACLAGVIFVVPLLMGGRHAAGQFALTALALLAALAWLTRQCLQPQSAWHGGWATWVALLALFVVALQTVPLPAWLLGWLSPQVVQLLPLWGGAESPAALPRWPCLSLTPAETQAGFIILVDYCLLFFVTLHRVERIEDVQRVLRWCCLSVVLVGLFGLVQFLFSNGKFFWFYQHPFSDTRHVAVGPFSNRNHFAHFLALGIGPLLWWLAHSVSCRKKRGNSQDWAVPALVMALAVVLFVGLLSLSRGGMLATLAATAVYLAFGYQSLFLSRRLLVAISGGILLSATALMLFGFDQVSERWQQLTSGSLDQIDQSAGRRKIWNGAVNAIAESPLCGSGVGSFGSIYLVHSETSSEDASCPTHAENGYLQILAETGLIGFGLLVGGIVLCGFCCFSGLRIPEQPRLRMCFVAIAASLAASLVHAVVDFVWYAPACMALALILAACACRACRWLPVSSQGAPRQVQTSAAEGILWVPRVPWVVATLLILCLGARMLDDRLGAAVAQTYWDAYRVERQEVNDSAMAETNRLADVASLEQWIEDLEELLRWQPSHYQAHLALAELHRYRFDAGQAAAANAMSLSDLRDAAEQAQFHSPGELLAWLTRATGDHVGHLQQSLGHALQALRLCPLEGRAYVYLAELSFLAGADAAWRQSCIDQALLVRPADGAVLYAAAGNALLAGDTQRWLEHLKQSSRASGLQQQRIVRDMVAAAPAGSLPAIVEFLLREIQPGLPSLPILRDACAREATASLPAIHAYWAARAEEEAAKSDHVAAAALWISAAQMHRNVGSAIDARRCLEKALQCDPDSYAAHSASVSEGLAVADYTTAEEHARWCLQRRPNDAMMAKRLRDALKGRLENERRASAAKEPLR